MLVINQKNNSGQSILEVIVAVAIFSLIAAAMVSLVTGSFTALVQGGEQTEAEALAQEGLEAVRTIRDRAFNEQIYSTSSVSIADSAWRLSGEDTTEIIGQYTRTISFDPVCRDNLDDIVACPGNYTDVHTHLITSEVSWPVRDNATNTVQQISYLTNWDSSDWTQTNWSGGAGQITWSDATKYNSRDANNYAYTDSAGQVTIISGDTTDNGFEQEVGSSTKDWAFTTGGNYIYDLADIEVTGGVARLVATENPVSGNTLNSSFDVDASSWTYNDWDQDGGEVNVTGTRNITGGNPVGWVDVNFPSGSGDELGGYWQQSFVVTADTLDTAAVDFDWQVPLFASGPNTFQLYVFVDTSSGDPTIGQEVWSSGERNATSGWVSVSDVDVSSVVTGSGTYYLKIAVWLETPNQNRGPYEIGYDNVYLDWTGTQNSYPTDEPSIYPNSSHTVTGPGTWTAFTETATKNGGQIYYQLSDDGGTTWRYWSGSAWTPAVLATDYNIASVVDTNLDSFTAALESMTFRAFLESDGVQLVQLDNIQIEFTPSGSPWDFFDWDVGGGEVTPVGSFATNGGNPSGYGDITVPRSGGDEIGGYWEQSFTTYRDNPTGDNLNFDYKIVDFNDTPNVAHIRVYIDTASGEPVNQLGSSIPFSAEGAWTSATQMDTSSRITTAGVYYLKMAVWIETPPGGGPNASGPYTVGFDNVDLNLGNGEHPENADLTSSDFDTSAASKIQIIEWDETIPGTPYENKLQIRTASTQAGLDSAEWSGPDGKDGDETDYFTIAPGTLIHTGHNGDQWIRYRVFLSGDGDDTPVLEEVRVNYK